MQAPEASRTAEDSGSDTRLVLRNSMYLGIAEVLCVPMAVVLNAMLGRYLGPGDMGVLYVAGTIATLAFLVVEWGHFGSLPAMVVRDNQRAGVLLGTSVAWRVVATFGTYGVVALGALVLGLSTQHQWAIALVFLLQGLVTLAAACQDAVRGFERVDIAAYVRVSRQFASTFLVIIVLLLGGKLRMALLAQSVGALLVLVWVLGKLGRVGVGKLGFDREGYKGLMAGGTPFLFYGVAMVLQPNVDALYLNELSPSEVVGWYAVSRKLIGFLIMPATVLISAMYPTLCRLWLHDQEGFARTTRDSVNSVSLLVVPAALGCALYPDIGIWLYGKEAFEPAEDVLAVLSIYLFLVYFSMPIATALVAAGRQKAWAFVQLGAVVVSVVGDPFFINYYQDRQGNGGIGLAVTSAISELLMVVGALVLLPKGVLHRAMVKNVGLAFLSGGAMAATAWALRGLPSLAAAPIALMAYAAALYFTGAVQPHQLAAAKERVLAKLRSKKTK